MKKLISSLLLGLVLTVSTTGFATGVVTKDESIKDIKVISEVQTIVEQPVVEKAIEKRAIVIVSFGTSHKDTREVTLDAIENKVRDTYKDYDVFRSYTSDFITRIIEKKENVHIESPDEIFERLIKEGYDEVLVQPLHVIPGLEYDDLLASFNKYKDQFVRAEIGIPLLYTINIEEKINDFEMLVNSLKAQVENQHKSIVFMGHGTTHSANASYALLERMFNDMGFDNVYIGTVEGYPGLKEVENELKEDKVKELVLMPLMIVAGDHAKNDMAGNEDDSWKSILEKDGYKVSTYLHGLGENAEVQKIYIDKVKSLIEVQNEEVETIKSVDSIGK